MTEVPRCRSAARQQLLRSSLTCTHAPSSVCAPVACTTAPADPAVHTVPLNTSTGDSSTRFASSGTSTPRGTGTDSPVNADMSTSMLPVSNSRVG
jgi:hypothetical protein